MHGLAEKDQQIMKRMTATGSSLALTLLMAASPLAAAPTDAEFAQMRADLTRLQQRNEVLEAQMAQVHRAQGETWLNERRTEEVKALVKEVLADADTRASLLEGGLTAGHNGKNFFLASEDGSFLLKIRGHIQMRYIAAFADTPVGSTKDENESGFSIRRARVCFDGHLGDPRIMFKLQLGISRADNEALAEYICLMYQFNDNWMICVGQDIAPFLREELVGSAKQMALEYSYVNELFTVDFAQGVTLYYNQDRLKAALMVNDGMHSGDARSGSNVFTQRDDFDTQNDPDGAGPLTGDRSTTEDFDGDASDFALTGRLDYKLAGDWSQYGDFTAWDGEPLGVFLGAAFHWEQGESGDRFNNNDFLMWTADLSVEYQRFNLFAAIVGMHLESDGLNRAGTAAAPDYDLYGIVVHAGYQIPLGKEIVEPFIRWEWLDLDNAVTRGGVNTDNQVQLLTAGFNWYLNKHNAKFTLDVVHAFDPLPISASGAHLMADDLGRDGQTVLRTQFQLLY